jgi:hypothetical protein
MFKSDRSSKIMLAVNAGVPLVSLVTVVARMFRHMILAQGAMFHGLSQTRQRAAVGGYLLGFIAELSQVERLASWRCGADRTCLHANSLIGVGFRA